MKVREEAVAGQFYPTERKELVKELEGFFAERQGKGNSEAVIVPHAGYTYSGKIAAIGFAELKKAGTYIILSPNHTGLGARVSISDADYWESPLGRVKVNKELAEKIAARIGELDELAHVGEHSIEVQIPFLQYCFGEGIEIVCITLAEHSLQELKKVGDVLAELGKRKDIAVIASSDFTHFESEESAKQKDLKAIEFIEKLKLEGFHSFVEEHGLSICGYSAISVLLEYCKERDFSGGKLLKYGSSADSTGDTGNVVGYAAVEFLK